MRIGIVLSNTPQYSETFFVNKIKGLSESGFSIMIFANKSKEGYKHILLKNVLLVEPYKISKISLIQYIKTLYVIFILILRCPLRMMKFLKLERNDNLTWLKALENLYINAHILPYSLDWLHFGFATMGLRRENAARAINAKSAASFRGYDVKIYALKNRGCYNKLFERLDKVHSISNDLYNFAVKLNLPSRTDYMKITPAIDISKFRQNTFNETVSRDCIRILSVGRLTWKKGYEYALEAMAILNRKQIKFEYTIVGAGEDSEQLVFAAHQWGISDKVRFLGKQSHDRIAELMTQNYIYLQPSVQEGFCNAALEAQASGLLCIVTDAEGLPENVLDKKTGFVVPKRNPQAIADKIEEIIAMPVIDKKVIISSAVLRVQKEFNLEKQIKEFIKFYTEMPSKCEGESIHEN